MTVTTTDEWLTTDELASELKIAADTIRDWRKKGTGPRAHKLGHAVRYARSDVEAWIEQSNSLAV